KQSLQSVRRGNPPAWPRSAHEMSFDRDGRPAPAAAASPGSCVRRTVARGIAARPWVTLPQEIVCGPLYHLRGAAQMALRGIKGDMPHFRTEAYPGLPFLRLWNTTSPMQPSLKADER